MGHTLGTLLLASLVAANVLYLYDLSVTGPAWSRLGVASLGSGAALALLGHRHGPHDLGLTVVLVFAANVVALLAVAVLQLLQVQRDVAIAQAIGRRR